MDYWINKEDRGGGKPPWAYMIDRPFPRCAGLIADYHFTTIYDCFGICMGGLYSTRCLFDTGSGLQVFTVKGYGAPNTGGFKGFNIIKDIRTIGMIAAGCCPPAILTEYLGTEGVPS